VDVAEGEVMTLGLPMSAYERHVRVQHVKSRLQYATVVCSIVTSGKKSTYKVMFQGENIRFASILHQVPWL
jgi:hypothetical protein